MCLYGILNTHVNGAMYFLTKLLSVTYLKRYNDACHNFTLSEIYCLAFYFPVCVYKVILKFSFCVYICYVLWRSDVYFIVTLC